MSQGEREGGVIGKADRGTEKRKAWLVGKRRTGSSETTEREGGC